MVEHITEVQAEIKEEKGREKGREFYYYYDHKTSGVSCNGVGGGCSSAGSYEEAVEGIRRAIRQHNIWCDSWTDGKKSYRKNEKYKTKLFINGVRVPLESDSLLAFVK